MAMTDPTMPPSFAGTDPLTDEELDALEHTGDPDHALPDPVQRFTVTDDGAAEWCMRHVRRIDAQLAAAEAQAAEWMGEISEWLRSRRDPLQARRSFFEHHLVTYAVARREADPKAKTLTLPSGDVATTERKPVVDLPEVTGEAKARLEGELIEWLRDTFPDDLLDAMEPIKVAESILKTGLRKLLVVWIQVVKVNEDEDPIMNTERWQPMLDEKGKPTAVADDEMVIQRLAVPAVNPATGEAWPDDVPVPDRAAPVVVVTTPSIEAKVKSRPVTS